PAPFDGVQLLRCVAHTSKRAAWFARSADGAEVRVVFWADQPPYGSSSACPRLLKLNPQLWDEGWSFAIVTPLPAALPGRYGHLTLIDFVGMGGFGEVWEAESRDYPNL